MYNIFSKPLLSPFVPYYNIATLWAFLNCGVPLNFGVNLIVLSCFPYNLWSSSMFVLWVLLFLTSYSFLFSFCSFIDELFIPITISFMVVSLSLFCFLRKSSEEVFSTTESRVELHLCKYSDNFFSDLLSQFGRF